MTKKIPVIKDKIEKTFYRGRYLSKFYIIGHFGRSLCVTYSNFETDPCGTGKPWREKIKLAE